VAKMAAANDSVLTIALIESAKGVEAAADILGVPGIDMGWLGHYDLSDSLGCPEAFGDPRYVAAEHALEDAARAAGKPLGWVVPDGKAAKAAFARGFGCVCIGHDVALFRSALSREIAVARGG